MKDEINKIKANEPYKYGFNDGDVSIFKTEKGLNEDIIKQISAKKNEPKWMLDFRLNSYHYFKSTPDPRFGPKLDFLHYEITLIFLQ